jgi:hypothetical protein
MPTTDPRLRALAQRLDSLKQDLLQHPVYSRLTSLAALRVFMQHHVFAVWDFMSLLKALQRQLCCVAVPWLPGSDSLSTRFINEIVLGEEADEDGRGGYASHFELYQRAMRGCGASTLAVESFERRLRGGADLATALADAQVPYPARQFVTETFEVIRQDNLVTLAATFTFGREDLLPDVFQQIVDRLDASSSGELAAFKYYLQRHIELDGDQHGPMAARLMLNLCGDDAECWQKAEASAVATLRSRKRLWDGVLAAIQEQE